MLVGFTDLEIADFDTSREFLMGVNESYLKITPEYTVPIEKIAEQIFSLQRVQRLDGSEMALEG